MPNNSRQTQPAPVEVQPVVQPIQRPPDATLQPVKPKTSTQGAVEQPQTAAQPQTARPQTALPQTAQPQTAQPQTAQPQSMAPAVTPDAARIQAATDRAREAWVPYAEQSMAQQAQNEKFYRSSYVPYYAGQNTSNFNPSVDTQGNSAVDFWLSQYKAQLDPYGRMSYNLPYGDNYAAIVDPYVNDEVYGINNDWSAKMQTETDPYGLIDYGGRRIAKEAILGNQGGPTNEDLYYQAWLKDPNIWSANSPEKYGAAGSAAYYSDRYSNISPEERAQLQSAIYAPKTAVEVARHNNMIGIYQNEGNPQKIAEYQQQAYQNRQNAIAQLQKQIEQNSAAWYNATDEEKEALHNANEAYRKYIDQLGDDAHWAQLEAYQTAIERQLDAENGALDAGNGAKDAAQAEAQRYAQGYANMENLLEQWRRAASNQAINAQDYNTARGINELQRANEDAAAQYQNERNQIERDQRNALDNSALYAELRGDNGGIGHAQYDSIQNTAAKNHQAVRDAQTKLATDTARQVADLRAQGEFAKADQLLQISQTYLNRLMELEQWGIANGVDISGQAEGYLDPNVVSAANGWNMDFFSGTGTKGPSAQAILDSQADLAKYREAYQAWKDGSASLNQNRNNYYVPSRQSTGFSGAVYAPGYGQIDAADADWLVKNGYLYSTGWDPGTGLPTFGQTTKPWDQNFEISR